jgi:hypothetical protein
MKGDIKMRKVEERKQAILNEFRKAEKKYLPQSYINELEKIRAKNEPGFGEELARQILTKIEENIKKSDPEKAE